MWNTPEGEAVTSWSGAGGPPQPIIAAQCCTGPGWNGGAFTNSVCRRRLTNNDDCIAGPSDSIVSYTFEQTLEKCTTLGLQLCDFSCRGQGCWYNSHPVWSNVPCPAAP